MDVVVVVTRLPTAFEFHITRSLSCFTDPRIITFFFMCFGLIVGDWCFLIFACLGVELITLPVLEVGMQFV